MTIVLQYVLVHTKFSLQGWAASAVSKMHAACACQVQSLLNIPASSKHAASCNAAIAMLL
jgi:hypothetical protein